MNGEVAILKMWYDRKGVAVGDGYCDAVPANSVLMMDCRNDTVRALLQKGRQCDDEYFCVVAAGTEGLRG